MTMTFAPPIGVSFEVEEGVQPRIETTPRGKGYASVRVTGLRDPLTYNLRWKSIGKTTLDYLRSFFHIVRADAFFWTPPGTVASPSALTPTLSTVTSGALALRTYFVKFTWFDSSGSLETLSSAQSTLAVPANSVLKVTLPVFPTGVDRTRVYASETSGSETLQSTVSVRTWQEPDTGLVAGAALPAANNLSKQLLFRLNTPPSFTQFASNRWRSELAFIEEFVA